MTLVEEFLKPKEEGDIPYIYAKKILPMEHTYPLFDKSWEGLQFIMKNGKKTLEIVTNQNVRIDGRNGECRIPDTENNRKRLEKLCTTRKTKGTHRVLQDDGTYKDEPATITVPPAFKRLDENLVEKQVLDTMEAKLLDRLREKYDIVEKDRDPVVLEEQKPLEAESKPGGKLFKFMPSEQELDIPEHPVSKKKRERDEILKPINK